MRLERVFLVSKLTPTAEGILVLGEEYALTYLQQDLQTVALKALHRSFLLSKFDGSVVHITADGVSSVPSPTNFS